MVFKRRWNSEKSLHQSEPLCTLDTYPWFEVTDA